MNREHIYIYQSGATREIMDCIRRTNKRPETRRFVEKREALTRPELCDHAVSMDDDWAVQSKYKELGRSC